MAQERLEDLIKRTAEGDLSAYEALYDASAAKLFGICQHVLSEPEQAEEALAATYGRIWNEARQFQRGPHGPTTWLISMARETAVAQLRGRSASDAGFAGVALSSRPEMPQPSVLAAFSDLPKDRKQAIASAYLKGANYTTLAQDLDVPTETARSWLRRALTALHDRVSNG